MIMNWNVKYGGKPVVYGCRMDEHLKEAFLWNCEQSGSQGAIVLRQLMVGYIMECNEEKEYGKKENERQEVSKEFFEEFGNAQEESGNESKEGRETDLKGLVIKGMRDSF